MLYVGIDPGVTGAVAVLDDSDDSMRIGSIEDIEVF